VIYVVGIGCVSADFFDFNVGAANRIADGFIAFFDCFADFDFLDDAGLFADDRNFGAFG
jgi:hypothetical protein